MATGHELRCDHKLHGIFIPPSTVEFKCDSKFCGAVPGEVVVLHRFNIETQETITRRFQPVDRRRKVKARATRNGPTAVRST
jgi:hypothetical protein